MSFFIDNQDELSKQQTTMETENLYAGHCRDQIRKNIQSERERGEDLTWMPTSIAEIP